MLRFIVIVVENLRIPPSTDMTYKRPTRDMTCMDGSEYFTDRLFLLAFGDYVMLVHDGVATPILKTRRAKYLERLFTRY